MSTHTISPDILDPVSAKAAVDNVLFDFLDNHRKNPGQRQLAQLVKLLEEFMVGGKRIRPILTVLGWQAAGGENDLTTVVRVAASLEMFHAFALIHDDIMDDSDTRRGRPTIHRILAGKRGDDRTERFGIGGAVLLGDLAFAWSDNLLHTAGLTPAQSAAVLPILTEMRTEVMLGQYLDLRATGELTDDVDAALTVNRYKTAKYTVERPLHIGAALAGADAPVLAACTAFALPLGEAFQLRDDLLGVYGEVRDTGKSRLDDLRAGKSTALVALALRAGDAAQRARLRTLIGDPQLDETGAEEVRAIFAATGARDAVERMIDDRYRRALGVLDTAPFTADAVTALRHLSTTATRRNS
ncbi:polyprenyl synthetase family protein [Streptomyces griseomycini]|uniref:Geranylgeranyl diphosphate synthase type I n=1 Tax=Streptomyces griseomycini TaxID=66895 RepID=A0A7W7PXI6_9ACTN|nr:polyprenyl synthetase family protein [Streptomyces griseomycini]MBB4903186.1 geranylgeranyl diphosphate synthase type I [Streptomyces griseomycini]GGR61469.1 geranylgeranyl pyrophosphate synthase [Streptomyces griseomycini]